MWTGRFDLNTLRVDGNVFESGKKKLPIKKYPDRCGQALVSRQFLSPFQGADVLAKSLEKMGVSFVIVVAFVVLQNLCTIKQTKAANLKLTKTFSPFILQ